MGVDDMAKYRINLQFTVDVYASTKDEAWELVVDEIDPIKHWYDEADRRITIVDDLDAEFDPINESDVLCVNCEKEDPTVEGGLCEECFARLVPNEWHSKW